ncbi:uncharacterized protein LOC110605995 [Manihot esculenta]|uniref:Uncharacterized protein n=1 Tax=Manihot esculenta TaxID=3983 RepID=A0A2C9U0M2_MANES|nr:uncharacterized protein LOC110605995 [Manihot esculenta]OAY23054.1 hypothetical protein MANES_18G048000v8 [Manihot esculenta]
MGAKGHSQNKFMRIVTIPIKVLGKARDLYVKSMTGCAARASCGHSMSLPNGQLPKSYSMGSSMSNDNDDFRELIRAASVRSLGHKNEVDMLLQQMKQKSEQLPKSCSVGMGFMGRIDEEKASEEEGSSHGGNKKATKADQLYPRSKSYAVGKTSVAF